MKLSIIRYYLVNPFTFILQLEDVKRANLPAIINIFAIHGTHILGKMYLRNDYQVKVNSYGCVCLLFDKIIRKNISIN